MSRFLLGVGLFLSQRKEDLAGAAAADFKIGDALVINLGGEQELDRIVADSPAVIEFDESNPIVEYFKRSLLPFAMEQVAKDEHRLTPAFGAEIFQRMLRGSGASVVT